MTTLFLIFLGIMLIYLTFTGIDFRQSRKIIEGLGILILLILFYVIISKVYFSLDTDSSKSIKNTNVYTSKYNGYLNSELIECIEQYEYAHSEMSNAIENAMYTLEYADDDYQGMQWAIEDAIHTLGGSINDIECSSLYN